MMAMKELQERVRNCVGFRENIDPKMIALAILGVTNWSYNWFNPAGEVSVEELAEKYVDFVLYGISLTRQ